MLALLGFSSESISPQANHHQLLAKFHFITVILLTHCHSVLGITNPHLIIKNPSLTCHISFNLCITKRRYTYAHIPGYWSSCRYLQNGKCLTFIYKPHIANTLMIIAWDGQQILLMSFNGYCHYYISITGLDHCVTRLLRNLIIKSLYHYRTWLLLPTDAEPIIYCHYYKVITKFERWDNSLLVIVVIAHAAVACHVINFENYKTQNIEIKIL